MLDILIPIIITLTNLKLHIPYIIISSLSISHTVTHLNIIPSLISISYHHYLLIFHHIPYISHTISLYIPSLIEYTIIHHISYNTIPRIQPHNHTHTKCIFIIYYTIDLLYLDILTPYTYHSLHDIYILHFPDYSYYIEFAHAYGR